MDIKHVRSEYHAEGLLENALPENPVEFFDIWYQEAADKIVGDPNAFVLATSDRLNRPAQRTVLLKSYDDDGFVFFTNYGSRKGQHISLNANVSMLFQWLPLHRQIIIEGSASQISRDESVSYFQSRPIDSQLSAAVSEQSSPIESRQALEAKSSDLKNALDGDAPDCPEHWGGYRIKPERFEFWQGRPNRLHDRLVFSQHDDAWTLERLQP